MSRNNNKSKQTTSPENSVANTEQNVQEDSITPFGKLVSGRNLIRTISVVLGFLIVFMFHGIVNSLNRGTFSLLIVFIPFIGGFVLASLSRMLRQSGYFLFYKYISILLLIIPAVIVSTTSITDGFTLTFLYVFCAVCLFAGIIPIIFQGIQPGRAATIAGYVFFFSAVSILLIKSQSMVSNVKTVQWQNIYPFGTVFDSEQKNVWFFGDTRLGNNLSRRNQSLKFRVIKKQHPQDFLRQKTLDEIEMQKRRNKKENPKTEEQKEDVSDIYTTEASDFSWSMDRNGEMLAVTAVNEKDENESGNSVFIVNLKDGARTDIVRQSDTEYRLPYKSRTFHDYSTWSPDNTKFFIFSGNPEEQYRIFAVDITRKMLTEIKQDNVLSAFWTSGGELFLITSADSTGVSSSGDNKITGEAKPDYGEHLFDVYADNYEFYRWNPTDNTTEKIFSQNRTSPETGTFLKIHPLSGQVVAFNGKEIITYKDGVQVYSGSFAYMPESVSSGISPDGRFLIFQAGEPDSNLSIINLVNLETMEMSEIEKTSDSIKHITFSPDGGNIMYNSFQMRGLWMTTSVFRIYKTDEQKVYTVLPQIATGSYRSAGVYPGKYPYAFPVDPHSGELYMEQAVYREGFGLIKDAIILRMLFPRVLKPEPEKAPETSQVNGISVQAD
jgi:hypothetical protein